MKENGLELIMSDTKQVEIAGRLNLKVVMV
jgi:hypothetical protein